MKTTLMSEIMVTKEMWQDLHEKYKESILKDSMRKIIRDLPLEELQKIFIQEIRDPESPEGIEILKDQYHPDFLLYSKLTQKGTILITTTICSNEKD